MNTKYPGLSETIAIIVALSVIAFVGYIGGKEDGIKLATKQLQQEAINKGFAEYNRTNGNWQWIPTIEVK